MQSLGVDSQIVNLLAMAGTVASALIALAALAFSVVQLRIAARLQAKNEALDTLNRDLSLKLREQDRNEVAPVARREMLRPTLDAVVGQLQSSMVFRVPPHHERWDDGFPSLETTRAIVLSAKLAVDPSSIAPPDVRSALNDLFEGVMAVLALRDSFRRFKEGSAKPQHVGDYYRWADNRRAEASLKALQIIAKATLPILDAYRGELHK